MKMVLFKGPGLAYLCNGRIVLSHIKPANGNLLTNIRSKARQKKYSEEDIQKIAEAFKSVFLSQYTETSNIVYSLSEKERIAGEFYSCLLIYIKQFYPNVSSFKKIKNRRALKKFFNISYKRMEDLMSDFYYSQDIEVLNKNIKMINEILFFYKIIEDFAIRYYNYSVLGVSGQKYIVTSCGNCDKQFMNYLMQGYSLIRLQRLYLIENKGKPHFVFVPALPTKDVGFPIDEYIEYGEDHVDNMKLERVLK